MKTCKNKKAQVNGLIAGIGGMIVLVIIVLIITTTLNDSDLLGTAKTRTVTVTNESAFLNQTTYTLSRVGGDNSNFVAVSVSNFSVISTANYTLTSAGVLSNATTYTFPTVNITYTYRVTGEITEKNTAGNLSANLSSGINEIALKLPTILKLAVIVLLISVIAFLAARARPLFSNVGSAGSL